MLQHSERRGWRGTANGKVISLVRIVDGVAGFSVRMQKVLREIRPTLLLALPIVVGQVSQMVVGITDSVMVGRVGAVPLAAASFGTSVFGVFYVLGIGLMIPVSVYVAHARGASRPDECGEYLRHGLALAVVFGLVETLLMLGLAMRLDWFGQPAEVVEAVNPFFALIGGSIAPVLVNLALRQFAEAMGRPWMPVVSMTGVIALNVLLNWILIYGHWGAPALGLTGAGVATAIVRVLGPIVLFAWMRRDLQLRAALPKKWLAPLSWTRVREMMRLGFPAAGMLLFESGAFAAAALMMGWLGTVPLAAHQIALSCASFTFMFPLGLSMAAGVRVSQASGAGERERLRPIGYAALGTGAVTMLAFMVCFLVGGRTIAAWFVTDAAVIALAAQLLGVAAVFQFFDGTQVIGAGLLRGLKDVKVPVAITFVAYWGLAIGGAYFLGVRGWVGPTGVWWGLAFGLSFAAVLLVLRFRARTS